MPSSTEVFAIPTGGQACPKALRLEPPNMDPTAAILVYSVIHALYDSFKYFNRFSIQGILQYLFTNSHRSDERRFCQQLSRA